MGIKVDLQLYLNGRNKKYDSNCVVEVQNQFISYYCSAIPIPSSRQLEFFLFQTIGVFSQLFRLIKIPLNEKILVAKESEEILYFDSEANDVGKERVR